MDAWINNYLMDELLEAHVDFGNIIDAMKDNNIIYPYAKVISIEESSYTISFNAISRMIKAYEEYNVLKKSNYDFFDEEAKICIKYIMLYLISIIMIKVFSKTLSSEKINEMWFALVGLVLGSTNASLIYKNLNNYRYGNKENRKLMDDMKTLKEDYDRNFDIARREISYLCSLNRNLEKELTSSKVYTKK